MRCPDCPLPPGARCASDRHPLFCEWASRQDPVLSRHIAHVSGQAVPAAFRPAAPEATIVTCLYRDARPGGDGVCHAGKALGPDGLVWDGWCLSCLEACRARPAEPADGEGTPAA